MKINIFTPVPTPFSRAMQQLQQPTPTAEQQQQPQPVWLQLVSLQSNQSHSLNAQTIEFIVSIRNNAPAAGTTDTNTFAGGALHLKANRFWSAGAVLVPRIAPQASITLRLTTRPTVGFKSVDELDVEASFTLHADVNPMGTAVPCAGTFATDGAVWHKAVVEFAGDVVHARPTVADRSSINVLFVGAAPGCGTTMLINSALTMLSFAKHPIAPAIVVSNTSSLQVGKGRKMHSAAASLTPLNVIAHAPPAHADECCVRLLDIGSGQTVTHQALLDVINGSYVDNVNDQENGIVDDDDETEQLPHADRRCDVAVFVVPATMLSADENVTATTKQTFELLNRACGNALIAVTQIDRTELDDATLKATAQRQFGVSSNRVFTTPVYTHQVKRTATVERPMLALMLAATRQAIVNQAQTNNSQ